MPVGVFFQKIGQISNFGGGGLVGRWHWVTVSARALICILVGADGGVWIYIFSCLLFIFSFSISL